MYFTTRAEDRGRRLETLSPLVGCTNILTVRVPVRSSGGAWISEPLDPGSPVKPLPRSCLKQTPWRPVQFWEWGKKSGMRACQQSMWVSKEAAAVSTLTAFNPAWCSLDARLTVSRQCPSRRPGGEAREGWAPACAEGKVPWGLSASSTRSQPAVLHSDLSLPSFAEPPGFHRVQILCESRSKKVGCFAGFPPAAEGFNFVDLYLLFLLKICLLF